LVESSDLYGDVQAAASPSGTAEERALRLDQANRRAMDRALAEHDAIDERIRRSLEEHGA